MRRKQRQQLIRQRLAERLRKRVVNRSFKRAGVDLGIHDVYAGTMTINGKVIAMVDVHMASYL